MSFISIIYGVNDTVNLLPSQLLIVTAAVVVASFFILEFIFEVANLMTRKIKNLAKYSSRLINFN